MTILDEKINVRSKSNSETNLDNFIRIGSNLKIQTNLVNFMKVNSKSNTKMIFEKEIKFARNTFKNLGISPINTGQNTQGQ